MAVCSQIHTKHINTLCGQNVELLNVKLVVHIVSFLPGRAKDLSAPLYNIAPNTLVRSFTNYRFPFPNNSIYSVSKTNPITALDRPRGFQQVEAPRCQDRRHVKVVRLSALRTDRSSVSYDSTCTYSHRPDTLPVITAELADTNAVRNTT